MTEQEERAWLKGRESAWRTVYAEAGRNLSLPPDAGVELAEARAALEQLCEEFGVPKTWPDLHLADVIEKHVRPHLRARL